MNSKVWTLQPKAALEICCSLHRKLSMCLGGEWLGEKPSELRIRNLYFLETCIFRPNHVQGPFWYHNRVHGFCFSLSGNCEKNFYDFFFHISDVVGLFACSVFRLVSIRCVSSVQSSRSVVSDSLRRYGLQHQASCPSQTPGALLKLISIESVMPSNHLILCCKVCFKNEATGYGSRWLCLQVKLIKIIYTCFKSNTYLHLVSHTVWKLWSILINKK